MEVEEMVNKVRKEQGRAFDMEQLVRSCVGNVVMNMLFGHRFDHFNPAFQQMLSDLEELTASVLMVVELFPVLRFLPYSKMSLDKYFRSHRSVMSFIKDNIATCIEVSLLFTARQHSLLCRALY